jgi:hypothetical protein
VQTLAITITIEKNCWTLVVNLRKVMGTMRTPKVISNNKGRGRGRTNEK